MTKNWIPGPLVSDFLNISGLFSLGVVVRSVLTGLKSINLEHMKMPANWHIARFRSGSFQLVVTGSRVVVGFPARFSGPTKVQSGFVGCCWLG